MKTIEFDEWKKLDLRVAEILEAEEIEGADKLYKIEIDLGKELSKRTLVAGIKPYYKKKELIGKKCIVFTNLEPRTIRGIESKGMILAACNEGHTEVRMLKTKSDTSSGSQIEFKKNSGKIELQSITEKIKFEDWAKLEMRVGEIKSIGKNIIINCLNKDFKINFDLDVKEGDKIIIGFIENHLVIPITGENIPLIPDGDIEVGARVR